MSTSNPSDSSPSSVIPLMPPSRALMILRLKIATLLLIDVRSVASYPAGGSIRGSLHIPGQGFWWNRGMLYELAYKAGMEWVVFLDSGEAPTVEDSAGSEDAQRCAREFLQHVRDTAGDEEMQILVLEGGLRGWMKGGPGFVDFVDGFVAEAWEA